MSDILENAKNYRKRLLREIARLDEFLRIAEELSARHEAEPGVARPVNHPEASVTAPPRSEHPAVDRMPDSHPEPTRIPEAEEKQPSSHRLGLAFRNAVGPAELDRRELLA